MSSKSGGIVDINAQQARLALLKLENRPGEGEITAIHSD